MSKLVVDTIQNTSGTFSKAVDSLGPSTTHGDVGTYAFLVREGSGTIDWGSTYAGSSLEPGSVDAPNGYIYNTLVYGLSNIFQAGTWRCMGQSTDHNTKGSVFVRIS